MKPLEISEDFKTFVDLVNSKTFFFEKIYHSTPSGIDNTIITNGGFILYNKINGMKFIKSNYLSYFFDICIVNTKIKKDTKKAVETVRKLYDTSNEAKENIDKIGRITDELLEILLQDVNEIKDKEKSVEGFKDLIEENQKLLEFFQLSNKKIDLLNEYLNKNSFFFFIVYNLKDQ